MRNKLGDTGIVNDSNIVFGAEFGTISDREKSKWELDRGIIIKKLGSGKFKSAGVPEGFIITDVNKRPVYEISDLKRVVSNARGGILIEGIKPNGEMAYFVFGAN